MSVLRGSRLGAVAVCDAERDAVCGDEPAAGPPRDPTTDAQLLAGGSREFGILFDRYAAAVYRYCARRVGTDLADDVVAETFLVAYERRHRYEAARATALPWLYGIATHVLRRHRRDEVRAHRGYALAGGPVHDPPAGDPDGLAERVAERADASARVRQLAAALAGISQRHRDVLYLSAAGLDYEQIAEALGVPVGTVRSRLHRARTRLQRALSHDSALADDVATPDHRDTWRSP